MEPPRTSMEVSTDLHEAHEAPWRLMETSMEAHGAPWRLMELRGGLHGVPDNVGRRLLLWSRIAIIQDKSTPKDY